jgi:hypothetical protein
VTIDQTTVDDFWSDEVIQIIRDVHTLPGFAGFNRTLGEDGAREYTILFDKREQAA